MIGRRAMSRGLGVAAVLISALVVAAASAEVADRIVATIDGEPITAHELRQFATEHRLEVSDAQALETLITNKLLDKEIKAQGISARDDEIDRYVEEIEARNGMDAERFKQALAAKGMTLEAYRAKVKNEIEKAQLVNREIRQRVNVSPEEIRRYYDAHLKDYLIDERVRVRDIFFALGPGADEDEIAHARAKAVEVRELAVDGHDFARLAKQFSEGPGAAQGGVLGTFARGEMEREVEEAAFALEPGRVSEPVRTATGFHLLRIDERIAAGHRPLDEVKDDIREALYNEALEERFQNWLSRDLRERHHVEVLD